MMTLKCNSRLSATKRDCKDWPNSMEMTTLGTALSTTPIGMSGERGTSVSTSLRKSQRRLNPQSTPKRIYINQSQADPK